jgi:diamine N-acetyltransferase
MTCRSLQELVAEMMAFSLFSLLIHRIMIGKKILLRAPEPGDLEVLYAWENDPSVWQISNTLTPFSRYTLEQYILSSQLDIHSSRQLRLMIDLKAPSGDDRPIGTIDLFDYDPLHRRAGIGILINKADRGYGYASEALDLLIDYAFNTLQLHQLYCNISADNEKSLKLFQDHRFRIAGLKKEWLSVKNKWKDEYFLQRINESQ